MYAEVVGYGATSDAYHITAMHPEGRGAIAAMSDALADACIDASRVDYVNAHGTGTPMNDAVETAVLKKVFGSHAEVKKQKHLLVSSTKSMTGHMIGASGGAEIGISALALHEQLVPPTINLDEPDEGCDLDYVAHHARFASLEYALSNSFGFGGSNAVVVLKKI
jgi:3-oxoacyl-[acyl-carrier-protein] synthase II